MQLAHGQVAVVTGAAGGIGLALAERFAAEGLSVVLADVDKAALDAAVERIAAKGTVETLAVVTDVADEDAVNALAETTYERFGAAHVVCNNAGVSSAGDPWFGPKSTWSWVMGVNFWGVVHGVRAFLPRMVQQADSDANRGHIVNTASIAGLVPGFGPSYDASKHAVVALTEDLYRMAQVTPLPVGVSVVCPGWIRTGILDAARNWPAELGEPPQPPPGVELMREFVRQAIDSAPEPSVVADAVVDAITRDRFWVFPNPEFVDLAAARWTGIANGQDPEVLVRAPGLPEA